MNWIAPLITSLMWIGACAIWYRVGYMRGRKAGRDTTWERVGETLEALRLQRALLDIQNTEVTTERPTVAQVQPYPEPTGNNPSFVNQYAE